MTLTPNIPIEGTSYVFIAEAPRDKHHDTCGVFRCGCGVEKTLSVTYVVHKRPRACRSCVSKAQWTSGTSTTIPKRLGSPRKQSPLHQFRDLWLKMDEMRRKLVLAILATRRTPDGKPMPAAEMTHQDFGDAIMIAATCTDPEQELRALKPRFHVETQQSYAYYYGG